MLARAAAKLAEESLTSGAYGSGNANTNDYKAHAGREGLIGEAVVDAARLGYYMGMGCPTVAVNTALWGRHTSLYHLPTDTGNHSGGNHHRWDGSDRLEIVSLAWDH